MSVLYDSTRSNREPVTGKEAVLQGISPDGGLFVSDALNEIEIDLDAVCRQTYLQNAVMVLGKLLSGYTEEEIAQAIQEAYGGSFSDPMITPLQKVDDIHVLELFHGPTCAFKDVALTLLPRLMSRSLKSAEKKALILTATSGDTGKAAMSGFQDVENTAICVFYPHEKVSAMQYRQMASQKGKNVRVFAVNGNFDDAQTMVKKLFLDEELAEDLAKQGIVLSSANSINVGRLVPQIVYYFQAYAQLVNNGEIKQGDPVSFSVPTGNFGDVLAGYYAYKMGLPVKKFYVASNANDVLTEFLTTGTYNRKRPFVQTISPSMDILVSSNLERLLYYITDGNKEKVAQWMKQLNEEGFYTVDAKTLEKLQALFGCGSFDDKKTKEIIKEAYDKTGYVLDPHSAIAYGLAKKADGPVVALSTASPYKFPQDVLDALGKEEEDVWQAIKTLEKTSDTAAPQPLSALNEAPILHEAVIDVDQMKEETRKAAGELFA